MDSRYITFRVPAEVYAAFERMAKRHAMPVTSWVRHAAVTAAEPALPPVERPKVEKPAAPVKAKPPFFNDEDGALWRARDRSKRWIESPKLDREHGAYVYWGEDTGPDMRITMRRRATPDDHALFARMGLQLPSETDQSFWGTEHANPHDSINDEG